VNELSACQLRAKAAWCTRLANLMSDARTRNILNHSAEEFVKEATARDDFDSRGAAGPRKEA
jgi:hypothetical protein